MQGSCFPEIGLAPAARASSVAWRPMISANSRSNRVGRVCEGDGYIGRCDNKLFFMPGVRHLAGDIVVLARHAPALFEPNTRSIPQLGYRSDIH